MLAYWCCQKGWLAKQLERVSCLPPVQRVPARIPSVCCPYRPCPCPALRYGPADLRVHPVSPQSLPKGLQQETPTAAATCAVGTSCCHLHGPPPVAPGLLSWGWTPTALGYQGAWQTWRFSAGPRQAAEGREDNAGQRGAAPTPSPGVSGPAPRNTRLEEVFAGLRQDPGLLPSLAGPRELIVSMSAAVPKRRLPWGSGGKRVKEKRGRERGAETCQEERGEWELGTMSPALRRGQHLSPSTRTHSHCRALTQG